MSQFRKLENRLLYFGVGVVFLGGLFYFFGSERVLEWVGIQNHVSRNKVAEVQLIRDMVRRKGFDTPEFRPVKERQNIFNKDSIMTGKSSGLTLRFLDGSIVELGPDTLIEVNARSSPDEPGQMNLLLEVKKGQIKGVSANKQIQVVQNGQELEAPLILDALSERESTAKIPEPGKDEEVKPDPSPTLHCRFEALRTHGKVISSDLSCDSGMLETKVIVKDEKENTIDQIDLTIAPNHRTFFDYQAKAWGSYLFTFEEDDSEVIRAEIENPAPPPAIMSGHVSAPVLRFPKPDTQMKFSASLHVLFTWKSSGAGDRYRIEVSKDPDFKSLLVSSETTMNLFRYHPAGPAVFYWRVTDLASNQVSSVFSFTANE